MKKNDPTKYMKKRFQYTFSTVGGAVVNDCFINDLKILQ